VEYNQNSSIGPDPKSYPVLSPARLCVRHIRGGHGALHALLVVNRTNRERAVLIMLFLMVSFGSGNLACHNPSREEKNYENSERDGNKKISRFMFSLLSKMNFSDTTPARKKNASNQKPPAYARGFFDQ